MDVRWTFDDVAVTRLGLRCLRPVGLIRRNVVTKPRALPSPGCDLRHSRRDSESATSIMRAHFGRSGAFVWFEALSPLLRSDEADDRVDLVVVQSAHGRHVAEVPVVSAGALGDGRAEAVVVVMVGFVHDRQMRRTSFGATKVAAMTGRTVCLVQLSALSPVGTRSGLISATTARSEGPKGDRQRERRPSQRPPRCVNRSVGER